MVSALGLIQVIRVVLGGIMHAVSTLNCEPSVTLELVVCHPRPQSLELSYLPRYI